MTDPRFIADEGGREQRWNLAIDEALARAASASADNRSTLRLWRNDRCVVLGRFQLAEAEVDLAAAAADGTPVLRRFTGGGAVYHDPGNLNVTLVCRRRPGPDGGPGSAIDLPALYRTILEPMAQAMTGLGLDVERGERDLLVRGRKVSGVAGWIGRDASLVHATLLVDADLDALARLLAGPGAPGNSRWERTKSRRVPVTSLVHELAMPAEFDTAAELGDGALERRIAAAFGAAEVSAAGLTHDEQSIAARLMTARYRVPSWHARGG